MKTIVAHICREGGKTLNYLFAAIFALATALPSFAADWTDANDPAVTYTALRSLKGANSGYVATDITPLCTWNALPS